MAKPDIFIKLEGIKGESADAKHKGEIDVLAWNWASAQAGSAQTGGGTGSGKAQVKDLVFKKQTCCATPVLLSKHLSGAPIAKAVLTLRKAGSNPLEYVRITMETCIITGIDHNADDDGHVEQVRLMFSKVKYEYTPQKPDGTGDAVVTAAFDISGNTVA
jgi:type VI secretion system secreted protein Hcp